MKKCYLEALDQISNLGYFVSEFEQFHLILGELPGYIGSGLRAFPVDVDESWKFISTHNVTELELLDFLNFEHKLQVKDGETFGVHNCLGNDERKSPKIVFSPYIDNKSHLGDLIIIFEADSEKSYFEWAEFCDFATRILFSKYFFSKRFLLLDSPNNNRYMNFIHDTQRLLNQKKSTSEFFFEQNPSNKNARRWMEEDEPIIMKFLNRFKAEFGLHTAFVIQKAAPGYTNCYIVSSIPEDEDFTDDILEMIEAPMADSINANETILRSIIKNGSSNVPLEELTPLVFNSMAGSSTFGYLGFFVTQQHKDYYVQHKAKLIPMLANQLGFFFSHFYQLRKEAISGRKLQLINQACNIVNSSVDIGAILYQLVRSLNQLFDQYSGAIVVYSKNTNDFEVVSYLGSSVPENVSIENDILKSTLIEEILRDGSAFSNFNHRFDTPVRYILPIASGFQTPSQNIIIDTLKKGNDPSDVFQGRPSLGSVILFDSSQNRMLTDEELDKLLPILLNGMGSSLQVARNYEEKIDTINALEGLMNKMSDEEALLDEMMLIVRRLLNVNTISYLTLTEDKEYLTIKRAYGLSEEIVNKTRIKVGTEISGHVAEMGKSIRVDNIETDKIFKKRSMEQYLNRSLLSVPLISATKGRKAVVGVINVNNKTNSLTFTDQDQQLLEAIAHIVSAALDNVRYMAEEHEKQLMESQLNDAKTIQMSLLPKNFSDYPPTLDIYGKSIPARQIGGDFFDILPLENGNTLIALGDVSGKGMPAAILMAVSSMILRSVVQDTSDVVQILEKVNQKLCLELDDYHFVTFQVVSIDHKTGKATMSSAGHGPLMVRLDGKVRLIETNGGPPLGIIGIEGGFDKQDFVMKPGDLFISFTDGLSEESSPTGEMFGTERIEEFIEKNSELSSEENVEKIIKTAVSWRGRNDAHDDLTVLMTKYKG